MERPLKADLSRWLVIVPARLHSVRLPEKPLQDLAGKPLVVRVHANLRPLADRGAEIVVATDDQRIVAACHRHGVEARMTRPDHPSGTDRCYEIAQSSKRPLVMNVQGDEPFVDCRDLADLALALEARPDADMATLACRSEDLQVLRDPNVVKVVTSHAGYALYFSRALLPDASRSPPGKQPTYWRHVGIYGFRRERLAAFCALPASSLERAERLEQLRAIENGWKIFVQPARTLPLGIDTVEDLEAARARF